MSKQLYEDALADVKRLKEVAEDNAKRALVEAMTPQIRSFIESALLHEGDDQDDGEDGSPGSAPRSGDLMTDTVSDGGTVSDSEPDADGKVTLDLDNLRTDEFGLSTESVIALSSIVDGVKPSNVIKELESGLYRLGEEVTQFKAASRIVRESRGYIDEITRMISRVENMYAYVRESVTDQTQRNAYGTRLESLYKELIMLQERKMSKKSRMNESDVTLKLTGLPDDVDLDSVGVDLITGEEGEEGALPADDMTPPEGEEPAGNDLDLNLDGGEGGGEPTDDTIPTAEGALTDDTVIEIDEGMLRREISRMRRIRESADDGPDGTLTMDADEPPVGAPIAEIDSPIDEVDGIAELDQIGNRRKKDELGDEVADGHASMPSSALSVESINHRLAFEKRLQERTRTRAMKIKSEAKVAQARKDVRGYAALRKEHATLRTRFNESVERTNKMSRVLAEAKAKNARPNGAVRPVTESPDVATLRNKLTESNLFNAKLIYTNKLLQNEALSRKQKAEIIERLDEAKSLREVKLVYESLSKTLAGTSRPLKEGADREVIGSSSRATRPASTPINEGYETNRWAELAGIGK